VGWIEFAHLLKVLQFLTALVLATILRRRRSPVQPRNSWGLTLYRNHVLKPQHPRVLSGRQSRRAEQSQGERRTRQKRKHHCGPSERFHRPSFILRGSTVSGRQVNEISITWPGVGNATIPLSLEALFVGPVCSGVFTALLHTRSWW